MESSDHTEDIQRDSGLAPVEGREGGPSKDEFRMAFGESLAEAVDLATWEDGGRLPETYARLAAEVEAAVREEERIGPRVREAAFGDVGKWVNAAPNAGLHRFFPEDLERAHRGLLFNGGVESCDGTRMTHDALPITITQIGICMVAYNGRQNAWSQRFYQRDLRQRVADPVDEVIQLLRRRKGRSAIDTDDPTDEFSDLASRSIMDYAERAFLLEHSTAPWRMGHGHPLPFTLLTGRWAHHEENVRMALGLMRRLVDHRRFIYVPSAPGRDLLTLGYALKPMEYVILFTAQDYMEKMLQGNYRGEARRLVRQFTDEVAPQVVTGLYRVHEHAPPQQFYAHADHAQTAALIAMADSALQWQRAFPMLIDLADTMCRGTFDAGGFMSSVQMAYADARQPLTLETERHTRR